MGSGNWQNTAYVIRVRRDGPLLGRFQKTFALIRVAAVYAITGVTGVEANTVYSVLHTGNTEFCFCFFQ